MIHEKQREIRPDQWLSSALLDVSTEARVAGMMLWGMVDDMGKREVNARLFAGTMFPGNSAVTPDMVETYLLELEESGFLTLYEARGTTWLALFDPLKSPKPKPSDAPSPDDPEVSGSFLPKERGRASAEARAREWIAHEDAERAHRWGEWEARQAAMPVRPERPLILDAPTIGCPDHPHGYMEACGPCGTARERRALWLAQERYARQMRQFYEGQDDASRD